MAGIITHVVAAREISKRLPAGTIDDMGMFYLGNLAPDAVHAREGYIRAFKKHTHFREDIVDRDFIKEENRAIFHERLTQFIAESKKRKDGLLDLYRGFAVHNLLDELYLLTLRQDFCNVMEKKGIDQSDELFFKTIITDMSRNDMILVKDYEGMDEIRRCIEEATIQPAPGYVTVEEMDIFRNWMFQRHFYTENEIIQPIYISYEKTKDFIQMAVNDIIKRLSDDESFPKMF